MNELQRHLQAQRENAIRLLEQHNSLIAAMLSSAETDHHPGLATSPQSKSISRADSVISGTPYIATPPPAANAPGKQPVVTKGKVINLFDYQSNRQLSSTTANSPAVECHVFSENDDEAMARWQDKVSSLLENYGADDALAINRKQMADTIFLVSSEDALFYHKSVDGVMFVTCYVGPQERYDNALRDIVLYAEQNELVINIMAQQDRVEALKAAGLSTTPIGIWQRIEPVSDFTLAGSKMRRLRYLVGKYQKSGDCKTIEYVPGTDKSIDTDICKVMDEWVALKQANPPFVAEVQKQIMAGSVASDHRFFLTYRDGKLENVIVLSRDNLNDGYLMDLEFYAEGMPLGSTEFALTEIIECFKSEGRNVLSLGLTMGTGLFEHENRSQEVHELFESLKKAEYLDGDANAQYKNKYRPTSVSMFIARPQGCGRKKLNDLMMILGTG